MALKQPASQEQPGLGNPEDNKLEENVSEKVTESDLEDDKPVNPEVSSLIKVIEHLLIEKKAKPSKLHSISNNPLVVIIAGGFIGALLTHIYTLQQKDIDYNRGIQQLELTSQRSFSDELNKIRIQKIGEVWEHIDKNTVILDGLLEKLSKPSDSNNQKNQNVDAINSLIQEDRVIINKNRFWLGEQNYNKIKEYLDKNIQIALNMLLARAGTDLSELIEKREQAKQDILQIRKNMLLEVEPSK